MTRKYWLNLVPALFVGLGIIVGTFAAKLAIGSGWWVMTGPALLALFVMCAGLFEARLRGGHLLRSLGVLIMAGAVMVAGFIVAWGDPGFVNLFILLAGACCGPVLWRSGSDRRVCRYL